ncbi:MAG: hypothetical protein V2I62_05285 [Bacteroidales bacterium]|jgi:hypothetical protein|nr:hypothetical protein [Bacteroidales bacterium]
MKKYLFALMAIVFVLSACENQQNKEAASEEEVVLIEEIIPVALSDFELKAEELVGKQVMLTGTVDHVCKHGGQRMFVIETGSEGRVKVTPDENIAAFKTDLEGQSVKLIGIVEEQRIDEDYLKEWEEEIMAGVDMGDDKGEGSHLGGNTEKGGSDADMEEEMEKVNNLRQEIAESEKGYLAFYSVLCTEYEVVEMEMKEVEEPIEE